VVRPEFTNVLAIKQGRHALLDRYDTGTQQQLVVPNDVVGLAFESIGA
jgi:DNA mismatch repair ATPase MutS